jgi:hypothetical protein
VCFWEGGINLTCRLGVFFAIICLVAAPAPAAAQDKPLVFEFADNAGVAASAFTVTEAQTIRIRVYLLERNAQGTVLTGDGGLGTSAVRVTYGAASAATIANPSDIAPAIPPWADGTTSGTNADSGVLNLLSPTNQGVLPTGGRVFLGTFTFTGHRPGAVTLGAVDRNPASNFDTTTFTNGNALDQLIDPGAATLTVAPVPEPATVQLIGTAGLAALGGVRCARRRRTSIGGVP